MKQAQTPPYLYFLKIILKTKVRFVLKGGLGDGRMPSSPGSPSRAGLPRSPPPASPLPAHSARQTQNKTGDL